MNREKLDKERTATSIKQNKDNPGPLFNAWISPTGKIVPVDLGYHNNYVVEYLEEKFGKEYLLTMKTTSTRDLNKYLEDQGWIRVMNWKAGEFHFVIAHRLHIPQSQKKAITNICLDNDIPLPDSLMD